MLGELPATATTDPRDTAGTLTIRDLETAADHRACTDLQRLVWGRDYRDVVPGTMIKVSQEVGGLCAGAFLPDGRLIGFVYGLTGLRSGRIVHWSHMLAVLPAYRDRGVGRRLKLYQRERLGALGVAVMMWTFDPLVARNAHLNVNRLGAVIEGYEEEMYPGTGSDLHSFGTDRLVATWPVAGGVPEAEVWSGDVSAIPVWRGSPPLRDQPAVRIEIPADAEAMRETGLGELREWRGSTRAAFTSLFAGGWTVAGFAVAGDRPSYVLRRPG